MGEVQDKVVLCYELCHRWQTASFYTHVQIHPKHSGQKSEVPYSHTLVLTVTRYLPNVLFSGYAGPLHMRLADTCSIQSLLRAHHVETGQGFTPHTCTYNPNPPYSFQLCNNLLLPLCLDLDRARSTVLNPPLELPLVCILDSTPCLASLQQFRQAGAAHQFSISSGALLLMDALDVSCFGWLSFLFV